MQNADELWRFVDAKWERVSAPSDRVRDTPELVCAVRRSAAGHIAMPEGEGFRIARNLGLPPTAIAAAAAPRRSLPEPSAGISHVLHRPRHTSRLA